MSEHDDTLAPTPTHDPLWDVAIRAMLEGDSYVKVAEKCGVVVKTIYNWRKNPDFAAILLDCRRQLYEKMWAQVAQRAMQALNVLADQMQDESPHKLKIEAASRIIDAFQSMSKHLHVRDIDDRPPPPEPPPPPPTPIVIQAPPPEDPLKGDDAALNAVVEREVRRRLKALKAPVNVVAEEA
jgi:hypothetical protein